MLIMSKVFLLLESISTVFDSFGMKVNVLNNEYMLGKDYIYLDCILEILKQMPKMESIVSNVNKYIVQESIYVYV